MGPKKVTRHSVLRKVDSKRLVDAMDAMPPARRTENHDRDCRIVCARYVDGVPKRKIADDFRMSQQNVDRITKAMYERMKEQPLHGKPIRAEEEKQSSEALEQMAEKDELLRRLLEQAKRT